MPVRTIEPLLGQRQPSPDLREVRGWLEALTSGACGEAAFLEALPAFTRDAPDAAWDLLALLDQYYRRGRISSESFHRLKSHLELQLLGPEPAVGISVPLPGKTDSLAHTDQTVPIVASALRAGLAFDRDSRPSQVAERLKPVGSASTEERLDAASGRGLMPAVCAAVLAMLAAGWWAATILPRQAIDGRRHTAPAPAKSLPSVELAERDAGLRTANTGSARRAAPSSASASTTPSTASDPSAASGTQGATGGAPPPPLARATQSVSPRPAPESAMSAASAASSRAGTALPLAGAPVRSLKSSPGRSRIELAANSVEVPPTDPMAHVVVRRTGSSRGDARFSWWTESGTAKPGKDFAPVAAREEQFENGKNSVSLFIPLIADSSRRLPKSFYVMIADPSDGASIGARNIAMVTIAPL